MKKLHFMFNHNSNITLVAKRFIDNYGQCEIEKAEAVISLGGDGSLLHAMHAVIKASLNLPIFGINLGSVGFLINDNLPEISLYDRLLATEVIQLNPLKVTLHFTNKQSEIHYAFNDVAINRSSKNASKLKLLVDSDCVIPEMIGDGLVIATPLGSSAYNRSAGGAVLPLTSNLISLTPIACYQPKHWKGALLPNKHNLTLHINNDTNRPVRVTTDFTEHEQVTTIYIENLDEKTITLLHDRHKPLRKKYLYTQFNPT